MGIVLIGMGTIDAMAPVATLDVGMKEHLLRTKNLRYTPAWIWGMSDNVSPGLLELGRRFPHFPIYVVPGGQHGGSKETGFLKQVGSLPEVQENLFAFAQHHFFNTRPLVATPRIKPHWEKAAQRLRVLVTLPDRSQPQHNELWWSVDRHPDYTFAREYDRWQSAPLRQTGPATWVGEVTLATKPKTVDIVTTHQHTAGGSTLTISSPLVQLTVRGGKVR